MVNNNDETTLFMRLEAAVRVFFWVQDNLPGEDLGQNSKALALIDVKKTLSDLDFLRGSFKFDAKAAHDEMVLKNDETKNELDRRTAIAQSLLE